VKHKVILVLSSDKGGVGTKQTVTVGRPKSKKEKDAGDSMPIIVGDVSSYSGGLHPQRSGSLSDAGFWGSSPSGGGEGRVPGVGVLARARDQGVV